MQSNIHNIKELKPNKNSRYQQGYIKASACKKLFPSLQCQPIIFRSSYEKKFVQWLESNPNVRYWGSECVRVPYTYVDNQIHSYYPDYLVEMNDGSRILVEIKPLNQTIRPEEKNDWAFQTWMKNTCKWKAAKKFCEDRNMQFQILTENTISKL